MSGNVDLDIDNYSLEDLLTIFEIDKPITIGELVDKSKELIKNYTINNNEELSEFFKRGAAKLIKEFENVFDLLTGKEEDNEAVDVLDNEYYRENTIVDNLSNNVPNRKTNINVVTPNHSVQVARRLLVPNTYNPPNLQGTLNPTLRNNYETSILIDSQYREIRQNGQSTSCTFNNAPGDIKITRLDKSTDFTTNLSESVTNVISMKVDSIEIPMNSYYPFSPSYGTTTFDISYNVAGASWVCVDISAGFYPVFSDDPNILDISAAINPHLNHGLQLKIDGNTQKTTISGINKFSIAFYQDDCYSNCNDPSGCRNGKKIDSNLGWLLGFRQPIYRNVTSITSESTVNPWGTKYILLIVDDLNRNRTSGNLITTINTQTKFKLPEYYLKTSQMFPACPPACAWPGPPTTAFFLVDPPVPPDGGYPRIGDIPHVLQNFLADGTDLGGRVRLISYVNPPAVGVDVDPPSGTYEFNISGEDGYSIYSMDVGSRWKEVGEDALSLSITFVRLGSPPGIKFRPPKNQQFPLGKKRDCRRGTQPGTLLVDGSNNLTQAQKYTVTEILNAQKTANQDVYLPPTATNLLYRFPVNRDVTNILKGNAAPLNIVNTTNSGKREYFGPVTLKTLRVSLLNDKGYVLDLNGADWSLNLSVERLYQY